MSTAASSIREEFQHLLEQHTKPLPEVALARLSLDGRLVRIIAQIPGESGGLRVIAHFQRNGELSAAAVRSCLEVFRPFLAEAERSPGAHPTIDLLRALSPEQTLRVELLHTSPGLFPALLGGTATAEQLREGVDLLDRGLVRCAEKVSDYTAAASGIALSETGTWITQTYAVACMNAAFSAYPMERMGENFYDKVPLKTTQWGDEDFVRAGVRFIPGCFVRRGAFLAPGTTVMPGGIVNVGAYVGGAGAMIDGGARVATGAQVGRGVKLGAGSGIEGILEPAGRLPSIIEDNVKIGANCEVCGIVEEGAVLGSGVVMAAGKKIFDLRTGDEVTPRYMAIGERFVEIPVIPAHRVAIAGTYRRTDTLSIDCIVLLEKDARDTTASQLPKNSQLYLRVG